MFKKLGDAGLLGVNKPVEYGGMGLDFKSVIYLVSTVENMIKSIPGSTLP